MAAAFDLCLTGQFSYSYFRSVLETVQAALLSFYTINGLSVAETKASKE